MVSTIPRQPILPRNEKSPVQTTRLQHAADRAISSAIRSLRQQLLHWIEGNIIPHGIALNRDYRFELDPALIQRIPAVIQDMLNREVLGPTGSNQPIILQQVITAYEAATATAATNIITQSQAIRRDAQQVLMSDPYRRRIEYLSARLFEEMQGFTDQMRTDLSRVLVDAIARGVGMADIAGQITQRLGVAESRGETIARTEINNAHRRAIWDQDQDANDDGIMTRLAWLSALSPTTRWWHAIRHGHIYTQDEVQAFYSTGANSINCKCTQVSILVDSRGRPLSDRLPNKLATRRMSFMQEHHPQHI